MKEAHNHAPLLLLRLVRTASTLLIVGLLVGLGLLWPRMAFGAGTLSPVASGMKPAQLVDQHVSVIINNGFAQTTVSQTFQSISDQDQEAIYAFPAPADASLSEVEIVSGDVILYGEVVSSDEARRIYGEQVAAGNEAGLAEKDGYQQFRFHVYPVRAGQQTTVRLVYYEPLSIDTGIGKYLYPLEEGGTDEVADSFWLRNETVSGSFSIEVEVKSAWPVTSLRAPGFENAQVSQLGEGHWKLRASGQQVKLNRDFVLYYALEENLPGRVEVVPYRSAEGEQGTFMAVITPGVDLQPIRGGADYVFILDTSGSMGGKLGTLAEAVARSLGELRPDDRFSVLEFSDEVYPVTTGWVAATPDNVKQVAAAVRSLRTRGGTNVYAALDAALSMADADRVTSLILVTDGVTNTGIVDNRSFYELMRQADVRLFGFLMGNSANWPLMEVICEASGGFYTSVSNADDIVGQILLAKGKIAYQAMHDVQLEMESDSVTISDLTGHSFSKVYRGQQLVLFGRYTGAGEAVLRFRTRISGEDHVFETSVQLPAVDELNPELERLWALQRVQDIQFNESLGSIPAAEAVSAIAELGVDYQIVTDHTSMLVLSDATFREYGIKRRNQVRTQAEQVASALRAQLPPQNYQQDAQRPAFMGNAPSYRGGGAVHPLVLGLGAAGFALAALRKRKAL